MKLILLAAILILASCQSRTEGPSNTKEKQIVSKDSSPVHRLPNSAKSINDHSSSFLDSIARKSELSTEQIKRHTSLDSVFCTGMYDRAGFTGDTVFEFTRGIKGAIVDYDDKTNCLYRFLLVFRPKEDHSAAHKLIYSDCDQDESAGYLTLRYKLLNDSMFATIETYTPANSKNKKIKYLTWKISWSGAIDSVR